MAAAAAVSHSAGRASGRMLRATAWIGGDQLVRLACGFFVGLWVARYLGPTEFGVLNHALAVVAILGGLAGLGIQGFVVAALIREPAAREEVFGAALRLRLLSGAGALAIATIIGFAAPGDDPRLPWLILICAGSLLFQSTDVIDWALQADQQMRVTAVVRSVAFVTVSLVKVGFILLEAPLAAFAGTILLEAALYAWGYLLVFPRLRLPWRALRGSRSRLRQVAAAGWVLGLTSAAIHLQGYFDQVLMGHWLGPAVLGDYAAAYRIVAVASVYTAVAQVVAGSSLAEAKASGEQRFHQRLEYLHRLVLWVAVPTVLLLVVFGDVVAVLLYGDAFAGSGAMVSWLAPRLWLTGIGTIRSLYLINTGQLRAGLATAALGAVINVGLNLVMIPALGAHGAILAGLGSFAVTLVVSDWCLTGLRPNARALARALRHPLRWRSDFIPAH